MIFTVSTCVKGHLTVNIQDNALVLFESCMSNHDSCIGLIKLSSRGPDLCQQTHT